MKNLVILIGNVGSDPEVKHINEQTKVAIFSFATSETYKNKDGEKVTNTEWHSIVCWRHLADLCENYITKGQQLFIEGSIKTRSYDDKDQIKRYKTEIVAQKIQMLGKKDSDEPKKVQTDENGVVQSTHTSEDLGMGKEENDDLPFILTIPLLIGALLSASLHIGDLINYL